MKKAIIAIVGRPNVGKSTLFNALAGDQIAIVKDTPGVTRDRIYADVTWLDKHFTLIDTGGIEPASKEVIPAQMREQAQIAIDTADVVIFMVDAKEGLTADDRQVAEILRRSQKPVVLAVNKVDHFLKQQGDVFEFYELGFDQPIPIASASKQGVGDLLDAVCAHIEETPAEEAEAESTRIAIIGRPNVGKSSMINKLLGEDRLIVSDIAGTTRDAIDTPYRRNGKSYVLIDTAGLRRKSKIKEELEQYSIVRAVAAVERADIVVLVIDATEGIAEQDAKIAGIAHDRGKGMVIAVNKWDAIEGKETNSTKEYTENIRRVLSYLSYAEIVFVSAKSGQRLPKLFEICDRIAENQNRRIPTGLLNQLIAEAVALNTPPTDKGKRLKIFYATQVSVVPPTIILFVNDKALMHFSYLRYLENRLRESFDFDGTPLRLFVRERKENE